MFILIKKNVSCLGLLTKNNRNNDNRFLKAASNIYLGSFQYNKKNNSTTFMFSAVLI